MEYWPMALRQHNVDGPVIWAAHISDAIRQEVRLTVWCRRFDPYSRSAQRLGG
jgi:hypothetical protein